MATDKVQKMAGVLSRSRVWSGVLSFDGERIMLTKPIPGDKRGPVALPRILNKQDIIWVMIWFKIKRIDRMLKAIAAAVGAPYSMAIWDQNKFIDPDFWPEQPKG